MSVTCRQDRASFVASIAPGDAVRAISVLAIAVTMALAMPIGMSGEANAATMTFGSSLSVPATEDTANNLDYAGSDVSVPGSTFHIPHDGADTALWNVQQTSASPTAPAGGQVVSVSLEGCAKSEGPPPLTQIHFQDLSPLPGGGARVNLTSQSFEIPVCGTGGASGSTVSTYQPTGLCVSQGDYMDFNDEGGFVGAQDGPPPYPAGVPYMVIGAVPGSTMDSFIANDRVGNGATLSPSETSSSNGFAANAGEELMLQATLVTGPDASPSCPGGTMGADPPVQPIERHALPTLTIPTPQLDGMNAHGVVQVAVYCHSAGACAGTLTLRSKPRHGSHQLWLGAAGFTIAPHSTGKVRVHLSGWARRLIRNAHSSMGVEAILSGPTAGTSIAKAAIAVRGATR